jgi:hypothetical protein
LKQSQRSQVYGLFDDADVIKYVGATVSELRVRLAQHWCNRHHPGHNPLRQWLHSRLTKPEIRLLEECDVTDELEVEARWIKHFGFDNLLNVLPRGRGFGPGYKVPIEVWRKSHAHVVITEETRAKLAISSQGRQHSEETKIKIGIGNRGKKVSEESRQRMRVAAKLREARKREAA